MRYSGYASYGFYRLGRLANDTLAFARKSPSDSSISRKTYFGFQV